MAAPEVDVQVLEDLDYPIICQAGDQERIVLFGLVLGLGPIVHCRERATWASVCRGCGDEAFACDGHKVGAGENGAAEVTCLICGAVGTAATLFTWRRLPEGRH